MMAAAIKGVVVAQKVEVVLVDDLDGSEAAETVSFGVDGRHYEIDLSAAVEVLANHDELGRARFLGLLPYVLK